MRSLALFPLTASLALVACNEAAQQPSKEVSDEVVSQEFANAAIYDADGKELGSATFSGTGDGTNLSLELVGISPGEHAFHLHTTGLCEGPDFTSAGGHLNPGGNTHGKLSPGGKHLGDLPNVTVAEDGTVSQKLMLDWTFDQVESAIFDEDGTAIMLHEGPDDYKTDPAGAAGPRIACGVVMRTSG